MKAGAKREQHSIITNNLLLVASLLTPSRARALLHTVFKPPKSEAEAVRGFLHLVYQRKGSEAVQAGFR